MNKNLVYRVLPILILSTLLLFQTSCASRNKMVYFQNTNNSDSANVKDQNSVFTPTLKNNDLIQVEVTAMDEESIKPFTLHPVTGVGGQSPNYSNGIAAQAGYLIDPNGEIMLPIIGKIRLAGLTRTEATEIIRTKLSEYVSDPVVSIRIQNFKVTVLGDVKSPGSFTVPNERITLLEAIGVAGDLNITGIRKNVLVIRDENGKKTEHRVDLTSNEIFSSPVYYLQQNDVVYVEPNRPKRNSSLISSTAGVFISITSLIITTVNLITK